jgi:hypothetical protein
VNDLVDAAERAQHRGLVAHVAGHQLDLGVQFGGSLALGMDLLDQAVEHANLAALLQQGARQMTANEAGAAGDQNGLRHGRPQRLTNLEKRLFSPDLVSSCSSRASPLSSKISKNSSQPISSSASSLSPKSKRRTPPPSCRRSP